MKELVIQNEVLYLELVDVDANPLREMPFVWNEQASEDTSETACVHVDDAHERSSTPDDHEAERSSEWIRNLETIFGRVRAGTPRTVPSDVDAIVAVSVFGDRGHAFGGVRTTRATV